MAYTYKKEEENKEFEAIPEGNYECLIEKIVKGESANGNKYLRVQLRIRDDIEQQCKNRVLSDFIRYDETTQQYNEKKINRLLYSQKTPENTRFETIEEIIDKLTGGYLIASIKTSEWQGKTTNNVYFYKPTEHPAKTLGGKVKEEDIVDDDMPF